MVHRRMIDRMTGRGGGIRILNRGAVIHLRVIGGWIGRGGGGRLTGVRRASGIRVIVLLRRHRRRDGEEGRACEKSIGHHKVFSIKV